MNSVSFSFTSSKVFNAYDAVAVRCAYILGEDVLFAGDVHMGIYARQYYSAQADTLKKKLEYLIDHVGKRPVEGISLESLLGALETNKYYRKQKHLTPQQIIAEKKFERSVDKLYEAIVKPTLDAFERAGMSQLVDLINDGIVLAPMLDDDRELENEKEEKEGLLKLSVALQDRFNPENPNDVYLVTREFDDFIKEQHITTGSLTSGADAHAKILSAPLFKFPAIAQFKATELQSIRKNVYAVNEEFRNQMDQWSKALRTIPFDSGAFAGMQQTFQTHIAPHIQAIQNAVDADERIILAHRANNNVFELTVNVHVCSVSLFWQYLTWANSLGLETLKALGAQPGYETNSLTSCLILQCSLINVEQKPMEEKAEEQPVLTKRKTLEID